MISNFDIATWNSDDHFVDEYQIQKSAALVPGEDNAFRWEKY